MTASHRSLQTVAFLGLILATSLAGPPAAPAAESASEILLRAREAFRQGDRDEAIALAQKAVAAAPNDADMHLAQASLLEAKRDFVNAIKSYDRAVELDPNFAAAYQARGGAHFKLAHIKESIEDFDRAVRLVPNNAAQNWQRALSYYYAGRFTQGKSQTQLHHTVNPRDAENSAWHFLCNAKLNGIEKARKELIPSAGDNRVPMREIQALFAGLGSARQVLEAAEAGDVSDATRRNHRFYAHLYVGLYFEALGDAKQAREHIEKAAVDFSMDHYMGDVARVHLQLLKQKEQEATGKK
jgi:lipoprotein NlpI